MGNFGAALIFTTLVLTGAAAQSEIQKCETTLWRQTISYTKQTSKHSKFKIEEIFADARPNDLYIGFTDMHTYFVFNGMRFDGGAILQLSSSSLNRRSPVLSSGAVLRIRDVPDSVQAQLTESLEQFEEKLAFTCSSAVNKFLADNGLRTNGSGNFVPSRMLQNLLVQGITTTEGQKLPVELYLINGTSLESHLRVSQTQELVLFAGPYILVSLPILAEVLFSPYGLHIHI
jgi:hypothetical protein